MIAYFELDGKTIEVKDGKPVNKSRPPKRQPLPKNFVDRETWLKDRLDKLQFDPQCADAYFYFTQLLDDHLSKTSYLTLALFFSSSMKIRLAREFYRQKYTTIYWFQFHWKAIKRWIAAHDVKVCYDGKIYKFE